MENKSNGLAIASFVLVLVWIFLCITIILSQSEISSLVLFPLRVICILLSLIFGIIALCKKQTLWAALIGTIISGIITIFWIFTITAFWTFVLNHSDKIIDPIKDFATWAEENPEIANILNNDSVNDQFEDLLKQRMEEKYWEDFENVKDIDWILNVWASLFGEMESVLTELSANAWTVIIDNPDVMMIDEKDNEELNILDNEEIIEEVIDEMTE